MARLGYRIIDPLALWKVTDEDIRQRAEAMCAEVRARTPVDTGTLQAGWQVAKGRNRWGAYLIVNAVPYAPFVEFGTKHAPAQPMAGPVIAAHRGLR